MTIYYQVSFNRIVIQLMVGAQHSVKQISVPFEPFKCYVHNPENYELHNIMGLCTAHTFQIWIIHVYSKCTHKLHICVCNMEDLNETETNC